MTDRRSACADYVQNADAFRPATSSEAGWLDPCGICFPDGEIDVDPSELVVAEARHRGNRGKIHRDEDSGDLTWTPKGGDGVSLRRRLLAMDPDEIGGGA